MYIRSEIWKTAIYRVNNHIVQYQRRSKSSFFFISLSFFCPSFTRVYFFYLRMIFDERTETLAQIPTAVPNNDFILLLKSIKNHVAASVQYIFISRKKELKKELKENGKKKREWLERAYTCVYVSACMRLRNDKVIILNCSCMLCNLDIDRTSFGWKFFVKKKRIIAVEME